MHRQRHQGVQAPRRAHRRGLSAQLPAPTFAVVAPPRRFDIPRQCRNEMTAGTRAFPPRVWMVLPRTGALSLSLTLFTTTEAA